MLARQACGVEWGGGRVIAVEVSGGRLRRALAPAAGETPALAPLLRTAGIRARPLHLVAWDAEPVHQVLVLPAMRAHERRLVLEREAAREAGVPRAVGSAVLGRALGQAGKDEVLAVSALPEVVERLLAAASGGAQVPRLVTTAPLALLSAVRVLAPRALEQPAVIAHLGVSGLTVVVVAGGRLGVARQMPLLADPALDVRLWAATEIQRSIRHFAATSKGQAIAHLVCCAHRADLDAGLAEALAARVGLPAVDLSEPMAALLPGGGQDDLAPGAFVLAFGAAVSHPGRTANLLPAPLVAAQRSASVARRAMITALALAVAGAAGLAWTARQTTVLRLELRQLEQARQARDARARVAAGIRSEREAVARRVGFLLEDPLGVPPLGDALREVARLAPDSLRLERAALVRDARGYALTLSGLAAAADLVQAQREFNALYFGLRASPLFHAVGFARRSGPAGDGRVQAPFAFDITLRLKEMRE
jgi:hypothetical protein